jgi:predicted DNA-binding transcriptional regulator AlpA
MSTNPAPLPEYVDQPAIAKALGIDRRTLRRLILRGNFPAAELKLSPTLLRWRRDTVAIFLASQASR